jgi:hypothetical protein
MKSLLVLAVCASVGLFTTHVYAQTENTADPNASTHLYLDVHHFGAGKVTAEDVANAHQKDLATQKKYGVSFLKYWVDENSGDVYCLASASKPDDLRKTHAEAHGLLPDQIFEVKEGQKALAHGNNELFLDLHELGAGKVNIKDVAEAHKKDLAVQKKYGVNLIDYWVDEKKGTVMCLAQAPDSAALVNTHKEAHGLIPVRVAKVKEGQ